MVDHEDTLGLVAPAQIGLKADDPVLIVTRKEGKVETGIHHIDESLDSSEQREVVGFETIESIREGQLSVYLLVLYYLVLFLPDEVQ